MAKAEYRSAIRSKNLIKNALADMLQEKPLDKITVSDIVRKAGINRGTFYAHYADIPDVIHHLVDQTFCRLRDAVTGSSMTMNEVPGVILRQVQLILEDDLDFYRRIMDSNLSGQLAEQLCHVMLDYLLEHESTFSTVSHDDYVFNIRFCAGALANLYRDWFAGKLPISLDELTEKSVKLIGYLIGDSDK